MRGGADTPFLSHTDPSPHTPDDEKEDEDEDGGDDDDNEDSGSGLEK